ncbi:MAG: hypothetical protein J6C33_10190 [Lachnospiraceae bacterium]|nr:hypothetical protein [Lachnospiraceae bacterium]
MAKKKETSQLSNRERRRQRRVRNQILSYVTLGVLVICLAAGLFFTVRYVGGRIADKRQEEEFAKAMAEMKQAEEEAETQEAETEETVEEYTEDDLLDEMVDASLAEMPLEDRVAGMFLTTPEALTGTDLVTKAGEGTESALAQYPVGGLVYAASNIQSESQFGQMLTDTIPKSKYPLFFILDDETDALTEDLSAYGINMEFKDRSDDTAVFRTVTLSSLLGDASEEGIATAQITGDEDALADACMEAWEAGADLLYVPQGFQSAYEGMLEKIQGNAELEDKVRASMENICRVKYRNRLEE